MLLLKSMYFRFFSVYNIGIPLFLENKSYPGIPTPRSWKSVTIPTIPTGSGQKLKPLGWWDRGSKTGLDLISPSQFWPPNSREQELSRYIHLSDSIHWRSLDIIKRVRPETQAHDLRDMLLLKSMYFRFYIVYSIGIPLFLENKSYPGIPTPRSWKSVIIPTSPTGSGQKLKPLGWWDRGSKTGLDLIAPPPPNFDHPILENNSYPGISTYLIPSTGDHSIL